MVMLLSCESKRLFFDNDDNDMALTEAKARMFLEEDNSDDFDKRANNADCVLCAFNMASCYKCSFDNELYQINTIWSPLPCTICQCMAIPLNQNVSSVCYIKQCPPITSCLG
ncbi:unnamed protein product, partial [Rotaria sordida]